MTGKRRKSAWERLEEKRLTYFLVGLVITLSLVYVALEFNFYGTSAEDRDEALLQEMMAENGAMPIISHSQIIIQPEQNSDDGGGERIRVVPDEEGDDNMEEDEKEETIDDTLFAGIDSMAMEGNDIAPPPPVDMAKSDTLPVFRVVEDVPQFPGGHAAFVKWLTKHLVYPSTPQRLKVQGKVAVTFIVERDGTITDIKVAQPLFSELDNEALRVMRMMPPWQPGKHDGKPCRTMVCVPIVFKL